MAAVVKQDNIKPRQRPLEPIVSSEKVQDVPKERICRIVQGYVNPVPKAMPDQVIAEPIDSIRGSNTRGAHLIQSAQPQRLGSGPQDLT